MNNIFESEMEELGISTQVSTILDKYNLNWNVKKTQLMTEEGIKTPFLAVQRVDTGQCFTTCKEGYTPFQNEELADMLIRISEKTGYKLHKGGSFNGGAKVYIQLDSPNKIEGLGKNNDTVKGYLTGINGHDGTTALKWGETNVTISCMNTFMMASRKMAQTARHTASIHDKVEAAIRTLTCLVIEEKSLFDTFIKLSEVEVKQSHIARIVREITDVDILDLNYKANTTTYSRNRTEELLEAVATEIGQKGGTLWGLMSGVTKYTSHAMPVPKRENARLESLYTGTGFEINNKAFAMLTEAIN